MHACVKLQGWCSCQLRVHHLDKSLLHTAKQALSIDCMSVCCYDCMCMYQAIPTGPQQLIHAGNRACDTITAVSTSTPQQDPPASRGARGTRSSCSRCCGLQLRQKLSTSMNRSLLLRSRFLPGPAAAPPALLRPPLPLPAPRGLPAAVLLPEEAVAVLGGSQGFSTDRGSGARPSSVAGPEPGASQIAAAGATTTAAAAAPAMAAAALPAAVAAAAAAAVVAAMAALLQAWLLPGRSRRSSSPIAAWCS